MEPYCINFAKFGKRMISVHLSLLSSLEILTTYTNLNIQTIKTYCIVTTVDKLIIVSKHVAKIPVNTHTHTRTYKSPNFIRSLIKMIFYDVIFTW